MYIIYFMLLCVLVGKVEEPGKAAVANQNESDHYGNMNNHDVIFFLGNAPDNGELRNKNCPNI